MYIIHTVFYGIFTSHVTEGGFRLKKKKNMCQIPGTEGEIAGLQNLS